MFYFYVQLMKLQIKGHLLSGFNQTTILQGYVRIYIASNVGNIEIAHLHSTGRIRSLLSIENLNRTFSIIFYDLIFLSRSYYFVLAISTRPSPPVVSYHVYYNTFTTHSLFPPHPSASYFSYHPLPLVCSILQMTCALRFPSIENNH